MSKFSVILLSLLRLTIRGVDDLEPFVGETKETYTQRFITDLAMTIRYSDKKTRYAKALEIWRIVKFIEAKEKKTTNSSTL